jgi:hypothetical protein
MPDAEALRCEEVEVEVSPWQVTECDQPAEENLPERIKFGPLILSEDTDVYALE